MSTPSREHPQPLVGEQPTHPSELVLDDGVEDHADHVPMSTYYGVFISLMVLLSLTVGAWYCDQFVFSLGHFSAPIAVAIAVMKAFLIVTIFMHVKFSDPIIKAFACTGLVFVTIMFSIGFNDYLSRPSTITARVGQIVTMK